MYNLPMISIKQILCLDRLHKHITMPIST